MWFNLSLIAIGAALTWLGFVVHRGQRHDSAIRELVDGADELESMLNDLKSRMERLRAAVAQLPPDMTGSTLTQLNPEAQVKQALKSVLAHRLWIREKGPGASQIDLDEAISALGKTRNDLRSQLESLDKVSDELAAAGRDLRSAYQANATAKAALDIATAKALAVPGTRVRGDDDDASDADP